MFLDDVAEYSITENTKDDVHKNISVWVDRFLEEVELDKVSNKTKKSYSEALSIFLTFLKKNQKGLTITDIGAKFINRFLIWYQYEIAKKKKLENGFSDEVLKEIQKIYKSKKLGKNDANFTIYEEFENSLQHRLTVLKKFLKFISENNKEQFDFTKIFSNIVKIKIKDKFTDYLTVDEMQQMLQFSQMWIDVYKDYKPNSSRRYAYRDSLMLLIFLLTGARGDEVVHIKLRDISLYKKGEEPYYIIKIEHAKGGKKRSVAVEKDYIVNYITYLEKELPNENYYLSSTFVSCQYSNKRMHPNTIREFANYIMRIIGINKKGLHAFRRGYATKRIMHDGADISIVAKELGNTSPILEKHYLKHNAEDSIRSKKLKLQTN